MIKKSTALLSSAAILVVAFIGITLMQDARGQLNGGMMASSTAMPRVTAVSSNGYSLSAGRTYSSGYDSSGGMMSWLEPCTGEGPTAFFPLPGIEKAGAQQPVTERPAPCRGKPFTNRCGDAGSIAPICGGTCPNAKDTCQPDAKDQNKCTCIEQTPVKACGQGGNACSGTCPKSELCVLKLVGDRLWCGCEQRESVPCRFHSSLCPYNADCTNDDGSDSGKECTTKEGKCGCFPKT